MRARPTARLSGSRKGMARVGDRFHRAWHLQPKATDRGDWLVFTDGECQRSIGLAVFLKTVPEDWDYIEITGLARSGKAAFGVAKQLCKCQWATWPGKPDLGECVCEEVEKDSAYVVVCSNWDKIWSWAGHADSPEAAERKAASLAPWKPEHYSVMRANKTSLCASLWRSDYVAEDS